MSTTSFFVELIVIGVGAAIWIVLAVLSIFGVSWLSTSSFNKDLGFLLVAPALSLVYVLGIITDRAADWVFGPWSRALQRREFENAKEYYRARTIVYTRHQALTDLYEYGRSRLRICRGWVLNAVLILIVYDVFTARQISADLRGSLWAAGTLGFGLLSVGALAAWRGLTLQEVARLHEQFAILMSEKGRDKGRQEGHTI